MDPPGREPLCRPCSEQPAEQLSDDSRLLLLLDLPATPRDRISRLLDALEKVIADEVQLDGTGYPTERREKGHDRIASATDCEAPEALLRQQQAAGPPCRPMCTCPGGMVSTHAYPRQAAVFNQTPAGRGLLARPWQVEPEVAWLTRSQGCRTARCLGREAAQFQVFQACPMRNLLRWLSRRARAAAQGAA